MTAFFNELIPALASAANTPQLWIAIGQIIAIDIVLAGDNAVVIALACRLLDKRRRFWGMVLGAAVAILMRIAFTLVVTQTLNFPYVKIVGGLLLIWIAIRLVVPEDVGDGGTEKVRAADQLWRAVWIIAVADIVMSLDNVIAIAAMASTAARSIDPAHAGTIQTALIVFGLVVSIPLIVAGSAMVMALLERFPMLIWAGAALLGWIAGELIASDMAVTALLAGLDLKLVHYAVSVSGAAFVVICGYLIRQRRRSIDEV